jgi:acyl carrier protein
MNNHVLETVESIIRDVLDAKDVAITRETQASDVDGWDSLSHAILMLRIESAFKIKFSLEDTYRFDNVGDLIDHINQLVNQNPV